MRSDLAGRTALPWSCGLGLTLNMEYLLTAAFVGYGFIAFLLGLVGQFR